MPLTGRTLWLFIMASVTMVIVPSYVAYDRYMDQVATEVTSAFFRAEGPTIQQGNLLQSIGKLQSVINASESLAGVVVLDRKLSFACKHPLIAIGSTGSECRILIGDSSVRTGLFKRMYQRSANQSQVVQFYFDPSFVSWSFLLTSIILVCFAGLIGVLATRLETIRGEERAAALIMVSQQVAHDIKSPLTALKMFSGVMSARGVDTELMQSAVDRVEGILQDLQKRSERKPSNVDAVDLSSLIRKLVDEKRREYPEYWFNCCATSEAWLNISESEINRVLSNLINNSVEASAPGSAIEITGNTDKLQFVLIIKDRGRGMNLQTSKQLFRRGFTFGKRGGSGLGLFHARKVITAMNGQIHLVSDLGVGTTVTIKLPLATALN